MKQSISVLVLLAFVIGVASLISTPQTEARPLNNCKVTCDPPYPFEGCPPCQEWTSCASHIKHCGCIKIPGCKI